MRLDQYLHQQGLVPSRQRGRALIMAGQVFVNGQKADKAGQPVPANAQVEVRGDDLPYVSRGGLKLEKALQVFDALPEGKICMDIGASTGGFTDCLLQNGAAKVYAVDVGYGQFAWKLRNDARVVLMERCNIRHVEPQTIPDKIQLFTVDVSFISLKLVFPVMAALAGGHCEAICLVKPQFEAGKEHVGKNGVVKDAKIQAEVIQKCVVYAADHGFAAVGLDYSPVRGPKGNIEYLLYVQKPALLAALPNEEIQRVCQAAHTNLT